MKRQMKKPFYAVIALSLLVFAVACSKGADANADSAAIVDTAAVATPTADIVAVSSTTAAVIVPIDINTATDAEILTIPGVGPKMLREFKEYRPWTSVEQFRREIGKYVDKAEVARLEQYIVIK